MTRPACPLLCLCALALAACSAPVSQTARELAAVETERVNATQAVAQTQAADATATAAVIWRATWDAQNVTLRQLDIEQTALAVRRGIAVLEMTREAGPANATSTAVANANAAANIARFNDAWSAGLLICGGALVVLAVILLFNFNEWIQARRIAAANIIKAQAERRVNELCLLSAPHIVTETTPDGDANHIRAWRAALVRAFHCGQVHGFTERTWATLTLVHLPQDRTRFDWDGYRTLMGLLDGMGVTLAGRGRERTWRDGWDADTPLRVFTALPLPSDLPEGDPPTVQITLRSDEDPNFYRSTEVAG